MTVDVNRYSDLLSRTDGADGLLDATDIEAFQERAVELDLWGGDGSQMGDRGFEALFDDMSESDDSARLRRVRNLCTMFPASSKPGYDGADYDGLYFRYGADGGLLYSYQADADDDVWLRMPEPEIVQNWAEDETRGSEPVVVPAQNAPMDKGKGKADSAPLIWHSGFAHILDPSGTQYVDADGATPGEGDLVVADDGRRVPFTPDMLGTPSTAEAESESSDDDDDEIDPVLARLNDQVRNPGGISLMLGTTNVDKPGVIGPGQLDAVLAMLDGNGFDGHATFAALQRTYADSDPAKRKEWGSEVMLSNGADVKVAMSLKTIIAEGFPKANFVVGVDFVGFRRFHKGLIEAMAVEDRLNYAQAGDVVVIGFDKHPDSGSLPEVMKLYALLAKGTFGTGTVRRKTSMRRPVLQVDGPGYDVVAAHLVQAGWPANRIEKK